MRKFMVIEGRPGLLVGSPFGANRFIGQSRKQWKDGEMPAKPHERYRPVVQAVPWHRDLLKPVRKGVLIEHGTVMATGPDAALKMVERKLGRKLVSPPLPPAPPPAPEPEAFQFDEEKSMEDDS